MTAYFNRAFFSESFCQSCLFGVRQNQLVNTQGKVLVANRSINVKLNFEISVAFCSFHKPYWPPLSSTVSGKLSENYNMPVFLNL